MNDLISLWGLLTIYAAVTSIEKILYRKLQFYKNSEYAKIMSSAELIITKRYIYSKMDKWVIGRNINYFSDLKIVLI